MSYDFASATSDYLNKTSTQTTLPFTMACWFNPDDVTGDYALMSNAENAATFERYRLEARGSAVGDPVRADARNRAGTSGTAATSTSYSASTWQHACAVFASTTSRSAYLNGGGKITNTTNVTIANAMNDFSIGRTLNAGSSSNLYNGLIAHACMWSVALSDAEVAALAGGDHPLTVQRASIVEYVPLTNSTVMLGTGTLTTNGSPAIGASDPTVDRWMPLFRNHLAMQGMA